MSLTRAVALSGGPDSLCAAALMPPGRALIVDHGLRAASREEAEQAATLAHTLGHAPHILTWQPKQSPRTQAAYRAGRQALLARACMDLGIDELWTGHHLDDQNETLMLRLSMGSGLLGLSGMAAQTWLGNTRLVRPLLATSRVRILDWLDQRGLHGLHDPSNDDLRYPRVEWRQVLAKKPELRMQLQDLSQRMGSLRNAVLAPIDPAWVRVVAPGLLTLSPEIRTLSRSSLQELLAACVRWVGGRAFAPLDPLIDLVMAPSASGTLRAAGGVLMSWHQRHDRFTLVPEDRAAQGISGLRMQEPLEVSGPIDRALVRRATPALHARAASVKEGLWVPQHQDRKGGIVIGSTPRWDHVFATNRSSCPLHD